MRKTVCDGLGGLLDAIWMLVSGSTTASLVGFQLRYNLVGLLVVHLRGMKTTCLYQRHPLPSCQVRAGIRHLLSPKGKQLAIAPYKTSVTLFTSVTYPQVRIGDEVAFQNRTFKILSITMNTYNSPSALTPAIVSIELRGPSALWKPLLGRAGDVGGDIWGHSAPHTKLCRTHLVHKRVLPSGQTWSGPK